MPFYTKENENFWKTHDVYGRRKRTGTIASNAAAIRSLQKKVSGMKPELQQFIKNTDFNFTASGYEQVRVDITGLLAASTDRDQRITGDSWKNKFLKLRWANNSIVSQNGILRILVVKPKKPGTTFTFPENGIIDPNKMTTYYDRTFSIDNENLKRSGQATISLKNTKSTYLGQVPEAGDIQVYFIYRNCNGGTTSYTLNTALQLNYTDM